MQKKIPQYRDASYQQRGMIAGEAASALPGTYNVSSTFQTSEDIEVLRESVLRLISTTPGLRAIFHLEKTGKIWREISAEHQIDDLVVAGKTILSNAEKEQWLQENAKENIFLPGKALVRFYYAPATIHNHVQVVAHHSIIDAWSIDLLCEKLQQIISGGPNYEPENESEDVYEEFVAEQKIYARSARADEDRRFWRNYLKDWPNLADLSDTSKDEESQCGAFTIKRTVRQEHVEQLQRISKIDKLGMPPLFLSAYIASLSAFIDSIDIAIATATLNRSTKEQLKSINLFSSMNVIRHKIDFNQSQIDFARKIKSNFGIVKHHGRIGLDEITSLHRDAENNKHDALIKYGFNYIKRAPPVRKLNCAAGSRRVDIENRSAFALTLEVRNEESGSIELIYEFDRRCCVKNDVEQLADVIDAYLEQIIKSSAEDTVAVATNSAIGALWGQTDRRGTQSIKRHMFSRLHDCFFDSATRYPQEIAIITHERSFTYAEVEVLVGAAACGLLDKGIKPLQRVLVSNKIDAFIPIVAIALSKIGAVYIPVDLDQHDEKISLIIGITGSEVLLKGSRELVVRKDIHVVNYVDLLEASTASTKLDECADANDKYPAYVIFTSGTTGNPKGVEVSHRAILNTLENTKCWAEECSERHILNLNLCFDASLLALYGWFLNGGSLVVPAPGTEKNPEDVVHYIFRFKVTDVAIPAAISHMYARSYAANLDKTKTSPLKRVIIGGSAIDAQKAAELFAKFGSARLIVQYGPTESAVTATQIEYPQSSLAKGNLIGHPITNMQAFVMMGDADVVRPLGAKGELVLAGIGLANRYLRDEALEPERNKIGPLYRTGDIVRWTNSTGLEYYGRLDDQVKVNGIRIELGEIATVIECGETVENTAVLLTKGAQGQDTLAAYVKFVAGDIDLEREISLCRDRVSKRLPPHMVPRHWFYVDTMPFTRNGKVDRKALADDPTLSHIVQENRSSAPVASLVGHNDLAKKIAGVWEDVLECGPCDVTSGFYDLGGDSIQAIQACSIARSRGINISVPDILKLQTPERLASSIINVNDLKVGRIKREPEALLMHRRFREWDIDDPNEYVQSILVEVEITDENNFLSELVKHYENSFESSSTSFADAGTHYEPRTVSGPLRINGGCHYFSDDELALSEISENVIGRVKRLKETADFRVGPSFRLSVFKAFDSPRALIICVAHHAVIDSISWNNISRFISSSAKEWNRIGALAQEQEGTSWGDWMAYLSTYGLEFSITSERRYWLDVYESVPAAVEGKSLDPQFETCEKRQTKVALAASETSSLLNFAEQNGFSLEDVAQALFCLALSKAENLQKFVFMSEHHGRNGFATKHDSDRRRNDINNSLGWFTTMFPVAFSTGRDSLNEQFVQALEMARAERERRPNFGIGHDIIRFIYGDHQLQAREEKVQYVFNYLGRSFDENRSAHFMDERFASTKLLNIPYKIVCNARYVGSELLFDIEEPKAACSFSDALQLVFLVVPQLASKTLSAVTKADVEVENTDDNLYWSTRTGRVVDRVRPASAIQRGLLFHSMLHSSADSYSSQLVAFASELLRKSDVVSACKVIVKKYEALRTCFAALDEAHPVQVVYQKVNVRVRVLQMQQNNLLSLSEIIEQERRRPFDPSSAPLFRFLLVHDKEDRSVIVWTWHHAIVDGWSVGILWSAFNKAIRGQRDYDPDKHDDVSHLHVTEQRAIDSTITDAKNFWRRELSGATGLPSFALPVDGPTANCRQLESFEVQVQSEEVARIQKFCRETGLTVATYLQFCWGLAVSNNSPSQKALFLTTSSGRSALSGQALEAVDCLIHTYPVFFRPDANSRFVDAAQDFQAANYYRDLYSGIGLSDVMASAGLGVEAVKEAPIFIYENYPSSMFENNSDKLWDRFEIKDQTHYGLTVLILPGKSFTIRVEYDPTKYPIDFCDRLVQKYREYCARGININKIGDFQ